jgi:hypothetical protein
MIAAYFVLQVEQPSLIAQFVELSIQPMYIGFGGGMWKKDEKNPAAYMYIDGWKKCFTICMTKEIAQLKFNVGGLVSSVDFHLTKEDVEFLSNAWHSAHHSWGMLCQTEMDAHDLNLAEHVEFCRNELAEAVESRQKYAMERHVRTNQIVNHCKECDIF